MKGHTRSGSKGPETCKTCKHFSDDPHELEKMFRSILILSSTYGSTRARAGICAIDQTFHDPEPACADFVAK